MSALAVLSILVSTLPYDPAEARVLYQRYCASCHGERGDGAGPAARYMRTPPRDFTRGDYQFRATTTGSLPSEDDLYRTISLGLLGTEMPGWRGVLDRRERRVLARYLMTLSPRFHDEGPGEYAGPFSDPLGGAPPDAAALQRGQELWVAMACNTCHGDGGAGDGPAAKELTGDNGRPITPTDLRRGWYRGGRGVEVVYRAITTGLAGSPMPAYGDAMSADERWDLARYVVSLGRGTTSFDRLFTDPVGRASTP